MSTPLRNGNGGPLIAVTAALAVALAGCAGPGSAPILPSRPGGTAPGTHDPSQQTGGSDAPAAPETLIDPDALTAALAGLDGLEPLSLLIMDTELVAYFDQGYAQFTGGEWVDLPPSAAPGGLPIEQINMQQVGDVYAASDETCGTTVVAVEPNRTGPLWSVGCGIRNLADRVDVRWFTNQNEEIVAVALDTPEGLETALRQITSGSDGEFASLTINFVEEYGLGPGVTADVLFEGERVNVARYTEGQSWPIHELEMGTGLGDASDSFSAADVPATLLLERIAAEVGEPGDGGVESVSIDVNDNGDIEGWASHARPQNDTTFVIVPAAERS